MLPAARSRTPSSASWPPWTSRSRTMPTVDLFPGAAGQSRGSRSPSAATARTSSSAAMRAIGSRAPHRPVAVVGDGVQDGGRRSSRSPLRRAVVSPPNSRRVRASSAIAFLGGRRRRRALLRPGVASDGAAAVAFAPWYAEAWRDRPTSSWLSTRRRGCLTNRSSAPTA